VFRKHTNLTQITKDKVAYSQMSDDLLPVKFSVNRNMSGINSMVTNTG